MVRVLAQEQTTSGGPGCSLCCKWRECVHFNSSQLNDAPMEVVVREGEPEPTRAPEVYASRQIVIYGKDGRSEITRAQIDGRDNYRVEVPDR